MFVEELLHDLFRITKDFDVLIEKETKLTPHVTYIYESFTFENRCFKTDVLERIKQKDQSLLEYVVKSYTVDFETKRILIYI